MRILLIGEYSRLHNSLKEGLTNLGHEVHILAQGDGFKKYPVDFEIKHLFNSKWGKKLNSFLFNITGINLRALQTYNNACKLLDKLGNYDVIQLINEQSIKTSPNYEIKFINKALKKTKKLYLLSCGVDHTCMKFMMNEEPRYSIMSAYIKNPELKSTYQFQLQYLSPPFKKLHEYILENCNGIIASDFDYHLPCLKHDKYLGLAPNPINIDKIKPIEFKIDKQIIIFHGINTTANHKKGNDIFTKALKTIKNKYKEKVKIEAVSNLPYKEYIKKYDNCHILLDQVYGYDQGYNALEAMAKGKVVFTGAEEEWRAYFNLKEDEVAINALPDVNQIVQKLELLIENPKKMMDISKKAIQFINREHHYQKIAQLYIDKWLNSKF